MPFDPTKPVQTRDGKPARIVCTDRNHPRKPVVALHENGDAYYYRADGRFIEVGSTTCDLDLVNVPEQTERYFNIYQDAGHLELNKARTAAASGCISQVKVTYEGDKPVAVELIDV